MEQTLSFRILTNLASTYRVLIILASAFIISLLLVQVKTVTYEFSEGSKWKYADLIAPTDFAIRKTSPQINKEKDEIYQNFAPYYRFEDDVIYNLEDKIRDQYNLYQNTLKGDTGVFLTNNALSNIKILTEALTPLYKKGIIETNNLHKNKPEDFLINLTEGNTINAVPLANMLTLQSAKKVAENTIYEGSPGAAKYLRPLINQIIEPNVFYDDALTQKFLEQAYDRISLNEGFVRKGDFIITRNATITKDVYQKLVSLTEKNQADQSSNKNRFFTFLGYFMLLCLILVLYILYVRSYIREVFILFNKMLFMNLWVVFYAVLVFIVIQSDTLDLLMIPFGIAPIIIKNFYNQRLAFFTLITILLVTALFGSVSKDYLIINITAGILIVVISHETRYWNKFFLMLLMLLFVLIFTHLILTFIKAANFDDLSWTNILWLCLNVFLTLLAYPLIPLLERIFGFTSGITLTELSDLNNPLLKELSIKAPGTFQHSLHVATLAESAAEKIGANSAIAKVGALYHDIGKIKNPYYFIENQTTVNPHDSMEYEESARVIIDHVPEGVRIAKKNRLPGLIIDIIKSHHGTTRTEFFYRKYLQKHSGHEVDEKVFTYPGPRPRTKEQVLVMMADSVEAAVKSLVNPTEEDINNLVDKLIHDKMVGGQFDRSDITFDDVQQAKKIYKLMLANMSHLRIAYPDAI
ncbi:MAG TPA: HDIG domain-containing protein [Saprospiraceae bacterium]|nr:HDIG domain-containing protein [Saprospiraceae bacterium]